MLFAGFPSFNKLVTICIGSTLHVTGTQKKIETFRLTFAPKGKSEFVPRDQVFPLFVLNCSLLPQKNYKFQITVEPR